MKSSFVFSIAALTCQVASTATPLLQWDPDTAADCVEWYNNAEGESCEYVRAYFTITPAEFHEWNPSVSLDCKPWDWQSYCIVTQRRLDATKPKTSSTTTTTSSTTSASSLGPSPTAWNPLGCYAENTDRPILEQNMNPNGDANLSILKCKNSCYRRAYSFAGVQAGNQCWCSSYVAGEWAKNQTDCNVPCTGDKSTFCGGKGAVNVFEALENDEAPSASASVTSKSSAPVTSSNAAATSSGAVKERALFGMDF